MKTDKLIFPVSTKLAQLFSESGLDPKEHDALIARLMHFCYDFREQGLDELFETYRGRDWGRFADQIDRCHDNQRDK